MDEDALRRFLDCLLEMAVFILSLSSLIWKIDLTSINISQDTHLCLPAYVLCFNNISHRHIILVAQFHRISSRKSNGVNNELYFV